jgi:hypothetical protein
MGEALKVSRRTTIAPFGALTFGEVCMRVTVLIAVFVTAIIASTSVAAADDAKLADLPTGDVWISDPRSQAPFRDSNMGAVPEIPPGIVMPDDKDAAPAEFNFIITLTLRRNDRHRVHAGRLRHAARPARRGPRYKFRPAECRR